jgi:serine protease Do
MRVGDWVLAIGNPFGLASSVSAGILSATERNIQAGPYDDFLQTDAAINPGNSGGPLFNLQGQVIGINTAIIGGGTGIGFAVPSNMAKVLLPQLEKGEVRRGWLGVAVQDVTPELARALKLKQEKGALVADVTRGTPAAEAGLQAEDLIVSLDGKPLESSRELTRAVGFKAPGADVALGVVRDGEQKELKLTLGERPDLEGVGVGPTPREDAVARAESLGLSVEDSNGQPQRRGLSRFWGRGERQPRGALIAGVEPGSPAEQAGLRPGMVVVEAGGEPVGSARELLSAIAEAPEGSVLLMRVRVGGGTILRALPIS